MNFTRRISSILPRRRIDSSFVVLLPEPPTSSKRTARSSNAEFHLVTERRSLCSVIPFSTPLSLESSQLRAKTTKIMGLYNRQSVYSFSSRRQKSNHKRQDSNTILANEKLVAALMKRNPQGSGPDDVQVRLVLDQPTPDAPAKVEVMSLAEAIGASLEEMVDLVGVSIDNDPPVIRGTDLAKLVYKREQAVSNSSSKKGGKKSSQTGKSFRFRAGIDTHDLDRKVKLMIEALEKGVECDYTVFTKGRMMREKPEAGMQLVDRVQLLVAKCGQLKRAPNKNPTGNFIRVQVEPIISTKTNK